MPRVTKDELIGYHFTVGRGQMPVGDERGVVRYRSGDVKTQEVTLIVFTCPQTAHQIVVPLTEEARQELVRQLTGGVVVAGGNGG